MVLSEAATVRVTQQLAFIREADRLKTVIRQTFLCDESRQENSAEHSWHLALMASILAEHADADIDAARVLRMLLVHDLVEIDAGDTFAYDLAANVGREEREQAAAVRIFGLLADDQRAEFQALWEEFEAQSSADARFAVALDRLQPLLNNHHGRGGSWRTHGVARSQVLRRMEPIRNALPALWATVEAIVAHNCAAGYIRDDL